MADSDLTTVAHIYKRRYTDKHIVELATREHPTFNQITKEGGFTGAGWFYPINYGNPQGISGTFADAQSGAETIKGVQLSMARKLKYGIITLTGEAMAAARGDKGAFYDLVTGTTDAILDELGDNLAFDLFRNGTGVRGRRSSAATDVVTLTNPNEVRNFKVGMTIIASPNADGSAARAGFTKVLRVSRRAGTITLVSAAAITGFANNDYLFRKGDPGTCMEGMESCTPLTAPVAAESFRGIDRSVDVELLSGTRLEDSTLATEEVIGLLATDVSTVGKKVTMGALYPTIFWRIARARDAKVMYTSGGGTADYGFEYINVVTGAGTVKVYSDPDVPLDRVRLFRPDAHMIKHLDEVIHVVKDDGKPSMRTVNGDSIEIRARSMLNYLQPDTASHAVGAVY